MSIIIKEINALDTYAVRHPVLREGRPLEDCAFEGDDLSTTFHLGAFVDDKIAGVATLLKQSDATVQEILHLHNEMYQLRGMAVLTTMQGKQLGKKLLLKGEQLLKEKDVTFLWFNARIKAVPFYEKLGYHKLGDAFEVPFIGLHFKMYKHL